MKKLLCVFVCLASLLMLLCSCQSSAPSNSEDTATSLTSVQNKAKMISEPANTEWKTAYLDYIEQLESISTYKHAFSLAYVDGDDIPELYIRGICEADGDIVCSYKNGQVIEQNLSRMCGGWYIERSGKLANQNGHMGLCYTNVYELDENGFTELLSALSIEHVRSFEDESGNYNYDFYYEYSVEDQSVSEEDYNAAIHAVFDFEKAVKFDENVVPHDIIKQKIIDCK